MKIKNKPLIYGLLAGFVILVFYISVLTFFESYGFALSQLKSLWYFIIPLAAGFGTQIGLYTEIKNTAQMSGAISGTGAISGGSMVACCSHFLLNIIPIIGLSGVAIFLMAYQKWIFSLGIISNIIGITIIVNHKVKMKKMKNLKGGFK